jgi:hypothetical protein
LLKIALLVTVLGFGAWSEPAWARPGADDSGKPPVHAAPGGRTKGPAASIPHRGGPALAVPAVPEPSALMIFAVGLLVAVRAPGRLRGGGSPE